MRDFHGLFVGIVVVVSGAAGCEAQGAPPWGDRGCGREVSLGYCGGTTLIQFPCGLPAGLRPGEYVNDPICASQCQDAGLYTQPYDGRCRVTGATNGSTATLACSLTACPPPTDGRRPEGYALPLPGPAQGAALSWLVASACIEHASVTAFRHLARELAVHGAPPALVERALAAAEDEVRHAAAKCELARRRGLEVTLPEVATPPVRDLAALARENAVEGCVRETWGALLATWQGARADDEFARASLDVIASDESRHAELAWDVDAWARSRLSADEAEALDAARAEAVEALGREALGAHDRTLREDFGAPGPSDVTRLFGAARAALWS